MKTLFLSLFSRQREGGGMGKFTFEGTARTVGRHISEHMIVNEVGVWTDGIGLYSDNEDPCAYRLQSGTRYKITVELPDEKEWEG